MQEADRAHSWAGFSGPQYTSLEMRILMGNVENWLRKTFKFKEIGWYDIGEKFTRYQLIKTRWFNIYLHQLTAPNWHPECHDHPWGFVAILLRKGYYEQVGTEMY